MAPIAVDKDPESLQAVDESATAVEDRGRRVQPLSIEPADAPDGKTSKSKWTLCLEKCETKIPGQTRPGKAIFICEVSALVFLAVLAAILYAGPTTNPCACETGLLGRRLNGGDTCTCEEAEEKLLALQATKEDAEFIWQASTAVCRDLSQDADAFKQCRDHLQKVPDAYQTATQKKYKDEDLDGLWAEEAPSDVQPDTLAKAAWIWKVYLFDDLSEQYKQVITKKVWHERLMRKPFASVFESFKGRIFDYLVKVDGFVSPTDTKTAKQEKKFWSGELKTKSIETVFWSWKVHQFRVLVNKEGFEFQKSDMEFLTLEKDGAQQGVTVAQAFMDWKVHQFRVLVNKEGFEFQKSDMEFLTPETADAQQDVTVAQAFMDWKVFAFRDLTGCAKNRMDNAQVRDFLLDFGTLDSEKPSSTGVSAASSAWRKVKRLRNNIAPEVKELEKCGVTSVEGLSYVDFKHAWLTYFDKTTPSDKYAFLQWKVQTLQKLVRAEGSEMENSDAERECRSKTVAKARMDWQVEQLSIWMKAFKPKLSSVTMNWYLTKYHAVGPAGLAWQADLLCNECASMSVFLDGLAFCAAKLGRTMWKDKEEWVEKSDKLWLDRRNKKQTFTKEMRNVITLLHEAPDDELRPLWDAIAEAEVPGDGVSEIEGTVGEKTIKVFVVHWPMNEIKTQSQRCQAARKKMYPPPPRVQQ